MSGQIRLFVKAVLELNPHDAGHGNRPGTHVDNRSPIT